MRGVFDHSRLLDLLRHFVAYEDAGKGKLTPIDFENSDDVPLRHAVRLVEAQARP